MARLGGFCFPGTGHISPMTALARALQRCGHEVVIYGIADCEARLRAAGRRILCHRAEEYPPGTPRRLDERLGMFKELATFRFTVERVRNTARKILRGNPRSRNLAPSNCAPRSGLENEAYRTASRDLQKCIAEADGLNRADDVIEAALGLKARARQADAVAAD